MGCGLFLDPIQDPTHACSAGSFQALWKETVRRLCHRCSAPPPAVFFVWTSSLGFVCSSSSPFFPVSNKASFFSDSTACFLMTTSREKKQAVLKKQTACESFCPEIVSASVSQMVGCNPKGCLSLSLYGRWSKDVTYRELKSSFMVPQYASQ